jgi:hypothetical protein
MASFHVCTWHLHICSPPIVRSASALFSLAAAIHCDVLWMWHGVWMWHVAWLGSPIDLVDVACGMAPSANRSCGCGMARRRVSETQSCDNRYPGMQSTGFAKHWRRTTDQTAGGTQSSADAFETKVCTFGSSLHRMRATIDIDQRIPTGYRFFLLSRMYQGSTWEVLWFCIPECIREVLWGFCS